MSPERRPPQRLHGVLGPAGPELTCERCFEQLDRHVELELAGADAEAAVPGMARSPRGLPGLPRGPREPHGAGRCGHSGDDAA